MEHLVMPLIVTGPFAGGLEVEGVKRAKVAVTPMIRTPPEGECVSISKASEIVAGCKRLEKEYWRWAHWELQKQFSAMQVDSALSTTT